MRWLQEVLRRYGVRSSELPEYLAELRTEREQLQAGRSIPACVLRAALRFTKMSAFLQPPSQ